MSNTVLVVGAGVIGATTALALAEQGFQVSLIEQAQTLGQGASGANGAQLSYSSPDAMASPATLKALPKLMLGLDSAFRLTPQLNPGFLLWGLRFVRNCTSARYSSNSLALLKLAQKSQSVLEHWCEQYNFEFQHIASKKMHLFDNPKDLEKARHWVDYKNQFGANQSVLSVQQAQDIEPALHRINADLAGAVYSPDEKVGDVQAFTRAAINQAITLGGGELLLGTQLKSLVQEGNACRSVVTNKGELAIERLVICAGYQASHLARQLGLSIAHIIPMAGYSVSYPITQFSPKISLTDSRNKIVLCRLGNQLRVAGMADVGLVAQTPPETRIAELNRVLQSRFPDAGDYTAPDHAWVGMRPMTADSQPVITSTRLTNVYLNAGHGMFGWTLAAGSADRIKNLVLQTT